MEELHCFNVLIFWAGERSIVEGRHKRWGLSTHVYKGRTRVGGVWDDGRRIVECVGHYVSFGSRRQRGTCHEDGRESEHNMSTFGKA